MEVMFEGKKLMDIHAKKGTKVKFIGAHTCDELKDVIAFLEVGKEYTVNHTDVHDFYTRVYLEEFPKKDFSSVMFEAVE